MLLLECIISINLILILLAFIYEVVIFAFIIISTILLHNYNNVSRLVGSAPSGYRWYDVLGTNSTTLMDTGTCFPISHIWR